MHAGQVQGCFALGEGTMEESWYQSRDMCRLGKVLSGLAPVEGAMEEQGGRSRTGVGLTSTVQGGPPPGEGAMIEPGGWSRGRCRHGQVQGGTGREPWKSQEVGGGKGSGLD